MTEPDSDTSAPIPADAPPMSNPALKEFLAELATRQGPSKGTTTRGAFGNGTKHNHVRGARRERLGRRV